MKKLLIANRGEIAVRISSSAADAGIATVSVYPKDDVSSMHVRITDESVMLPGSGSRAYLDVDALISAARQVDADAIHPGYGFLSESSDFAQRCEDAGIIFVGPIPEQLSQFGDKAHARKIAEACDVAIVPGTKGDTSLEDVVHFWNTNTQGGVVIKAISGGGGRGVRIVEQRDDLEQSYARCRSEAEKAFGVDSVYVETLIPEARHIEVQIVGDGQGGVRHLWDRDCSLQRNNQKVIEIAPASMIPMETRERLFQHSIDMAKSANYRGLATFEYLVETADPSRFYFIEANARLQVEHTVTEVVTDLDLVSLQLAIAGGACIEDLELPEVIEPRGVACQARINLETPTSSGLFKPTQGLIQVYEPPGGPGIRVDGYGYAGYETSGRYDSLLSKLIVYSASSDVSSCINKTIRALTRFRIEGVESNLVFLRALLADKTVQEGQFHTRYIDQALPNLLDLMASIAGTKDAAANDPLAVLNQSQRQAPDRSGKTILAERVEVPWGGIGVFAPLQGTVVEILVDNGAKVHEGQDLIVIEAMKMEHVVIAEAAGLVRIPSIAEGTMVEKGAMLMTIEPQDVARAFLEEQVEQDLDEIRSDLAEVYMRQGFKLDENRPEAVAKRHTQGHRTVRENLEDLCDPGTFVEYGSLVIAAQRNRRSVDDLMRNTPADGMVAGIGSVNQALFPDQNTQCMILAYDYMVLAGTQGSQNHRKKDRMFELAVKLRIPILLIAEGGGGRPGDTDSPGHSGLDWPAFKLYGALSGLVPRIAIANGRCFAGNAVLLGSSDLIIATEGSNIGIGGPAMIEGGGLGVYAPEDVGPMDVQVPNGVVDIAVKDEAEAVSVARQLLSYFQGVRQDWSAKDQRRLRYVVPENRLRVYDMRDVIDLLADDGSVLELRPNFGRSIITCFGRIEGRPVGIYANNPAHLSGAIDSDSADKAARFIQLCDAFDIPLISLVDCPGIMVGPEVEKTALVRHASRLFVVGTNISVPLMSIIVRKGYGLGAVSMTGGDFRGSAFTISWPTGEIGPMGLEGSVKLGFRKELEAIDDPEARHEDFQKRVDEMYRRSHAVNVATYFEIDEVIDPEDTRRWIMACLKSVSLELTKEGKKKPFVDTW